MSIESLRLVIKKTNGENMEITKKKSINTNRLTLKPFSSEDLNSLIEILTNDEITKNFMIPILSEEAFLKLSEE